LTIGEKCISFLRLPNVLNVFFPQEKGNYGENIKRQKQIK